MIAPLACGCQILSCFIHILCRFPLFLWLGFVLRSCLQESCQVCRTRIAKRRVARRGKLRATQLLALVFAINLVSQESPDLSPLARTAAQVPHHLSDSFDLFTIPGPWQAIQVIILRDECMRCNRMCCNIHCLNPNCGRSCAIAASVRKPRNFANCALHVRRSHFSQLRLRLLFLLFVPCKGYKGEGPLKLVTTNVTSCIKHTNEIASFHSTISGDISCVLMQESRIPAAETKSLCAKFRKHDWNLLVGPQPELKALSGSATGLRQPNGGVAAISRNCHCFDVGFGAGFEIFASCCQCLWVAIGSAGFYIINCYLPTGAAACLQREEIMNALFTYVASLGSLPVVVCGDFQAPPSDNAATVAALLSDDWFDVYHEQQLALGKAVESTYTKTDWHSGFNGRGKTRIDYFLLNKHALPLFREVSIYRHAHLPNHCPCVLTLDIAPFSAEVLCLKPHNKWTLPPKPFNQHEWHQREALCLQVLTSEVGELASAAERLDVEGVWKIACRVATRMLNLISGQIIPATRGSIPAFKKISQVKKTQLTKQERIGQRVLKGLCELRKKAHAWCPQRCFEWEEQLHATARNVLRLGTLIQCQLILETNSPELLLDSVAVANKSF